MPLTADSRPAPGPFKLISTSFIPNEAANFPASCAATVAAKAEDLRDPEKLTFPAEDQAITRPDRSVIEMIVLLKVAFTVAIPSGTLLAIFFLVLTAVFLFTGSLLKVKKLLSYFFLLATVLRRPLRVLEFVFVR